MKSQDSIVAEVRKARSELFAECGNDLGKLFARLRQESSSESPVAVSAKNRRARKTSRKRVVAG
jgi:hypothetical protein